MFDKIIAYSVRNKFVVGLLVAALVVWGVFSLHQLPIDAVPDITNNQVQIMTLSPTLATQEVEQFITTPIELSLQNLQQVKEIRSVSRFGLSVITVVFAENYDVYLARQLVDERLKEAREAIPTGLGTPKMAPISTGLGEIYQYVVRPKKGYEKQYSLTDLRTIQDWIVKRQLAGIEGVAEVNTMGGYLKQYEVAINPALLKSMGLSINDVYRALANSNENTGGAYIEKTPYTYYIRSEGVAKSRRDLEQIVVSNKNDVPVLVRDIAKVQFGKAPRYGALVRNGEEAVGGKVMMFKGANSAQVTQRVKDRVAQIQKSLPKGVIIDAYLVRDKLISTAIGTVEKNLIEGGLIVVFILVLMLGNWRAGLIVASIIPLAMLFAVSMMNLWGISANLMSLGAIDFGLIIDGAIIIVEAIVHRFQANFAGQKLSQTQVDEAVISSAQKIRNSAAFGEIIILIVYIPIIALVGIEGKMFKPMAQTVMLAIAGALVLSLTYVPAMSALFLRKQIVSKATVADRIILLCQRAYLPLLELALRLKVWFVAATIGLFGLSVWGFSQMGGEFIPTLEEGDLAMQHILPPGSSLSQSVVTAQMIQRRLLVKFPEITDVVVNIGAAEIPTDPMPVEIGDYVLVMRPKRAWTSAQNRPEMFEKIAAELQHIPGIGYEFSQPIQLRFNELMTGTKADIAIKLYGDNIDQLFASAKTAERVIGKVPGVGTVNVEQVTGMPQVIVRYDYAKMAQYGLHIKEVNRVIRAAFAGEKAGIIYEGERRFDLVIRLDQAHRKGIQDVKDLYISLPNQAQIPLSSVARIELVKAPMQISRENTQRRIVIGVNVGNSDVETLVKNIQRKLETEVKLPAGYYFEYGGQFENLKAAKARLSIALPIALALIFILLYFTFGSVAQAVLIFTAIPLSAIGGVWALQWRGLPFSISAGIGFIALFGVAVLNGIVLIGYFNQLKNEGMTDIRQRIIQGTKVRLRPVLMTAAVASLGFFPMAISTSGGAEVQRPLATVVIGGLLTATFLTLVVLPILYSWLASWQEKQGGKNLKVPKGALVLPLLAMGWGTAQAQTSAISLDSAITVALQNHPDMQAANLAIKQTTVLQRQRYNPGTTNITYQGDGLYRPNNQRVSQLNITQNFVGMGAAKARNALQKQWLVQNHLAKNVAAAKLKWQVQQLYLNIQYKQKMVGLYTRLTATYDQFLKKAKARQASGETNAIERLSIQSQLNKYQLLKRQTQMEQSSLEQQLALLLGLNQPLTTQDSLLVLPYTPSSAANNFSLQQAKQRIAIENAKVRVIKSRVQPKVSLGYAAQKFDEGGWLNGIQAGVQIPLFKSQNRRKAEAQKIQAALAETQYQSTKLQLKQSINAAQNAVRLYREGVQFYQQQLIGVNPELERIARLSYQTGGASYLELLNTLHLSAQNQQNYWAQVLAYNQAVVYYEYLVKAGVALSGKG
ncbi:CusA/CzcA family heavy metal efflux RND transporter [Microscilla marina]|uniref:Cation efflux system protein, AcrB/AcrD/AcrF family protein n=1 Tax=Microscilla marina ATCC 23134 TaxID=313606 RepID=A1ZCV7_MICM2|nr:CusA/CzcA family heavy metal efflux RND transporter [Microscilla marina]EAY31496.1 cation efflux system protein, AcrB/AcrD/AcrF family protein [Microscilla marina ATCC 23134]